MDTALAVAKKLIALAFFPPIVLMSIFLKVAQGPWENLRHTHRMRYVLLAPFILIPWAFNFCLGLAWIKFAED